MNVRTDAHRNLYSNYVIFLILKGRIDMTESIDYWIQANIKSILKEHVLGYLITRHRAKAGSTNAMDTILVYPLTHDEDSPETLEIDPAEEIVGIISAQPKSFLVRGLIPEDPTKLDSTKREDGTYKVLGYEFDGATNPNWKSVLAARIRTERKEEPE